MKLFILCIVFCSSYSIQIFDRISDGKAGSLQTLIQEGSMQYYANEWEGTIKSFETALVNYRMKQQVEKMCLNNCKNSTITKHLDFDFSGFDNLRYVGDIVAEASCIKLCKEEHPFRKIAFERLDLETLEDFERRKPYNFLQYAYFQTNRIKQACQAAQTYYNANPEDEQASNNLQFYRELKETDDSYFEDLEAPQFHKVYAEAVKVYSEAKYEDAIPKFEKVLKDFFSSFEECRSDCFKPFQRIYFFRFYKSAAYHILNMLDCSLDCESKLTPVKLKSNEIRPNFVATCLSYLQFCYYSVGNYEAAVPAAASVTMMLPDDEIAKHNMILYEKIIGKFGLDFPAHFQPRSDAKFFNSTLNSLKTLADQRSIIMGESDEAEVEENVSDSLVDKIVLKLNARLQEEIVQFLG